jgi:hypothetical protein
LCYAPGRSNNNPAVGWPLLLAAILKEIVSEELRQLVILKRVTTNIKSSGSQRLESKSAFFKAVLGIPDILMRI